MNENLRQPYQGQLVKFTNVVKGWQARWFILEPESGTFQYFLSEGDKYEKARGSIHLVGAVISPSDEDSLTFTVSPAAGESYKLKAHDTRDRQMWINRLRVVAEMHTRAISHNNPPLTPREHRSKDNSVTQNLSWMNASIGGLAVLDAFTQVAELLEESQRQYSALALSVEELPARGLCMKSTDPQMLIVKATSHATLISLDQCLQILRAQHSIVKSRCSKSINSVRQCESPQYKSTTPLERSRASSASTTIPPSTVLPTELSEIDGDQSSEDLEFVSSESEISDNENTKACDDLDEVGEGQRSVIMHILSQLKLGMDLTRVTLPTFILEKRSLLEMFADFLGHPDAFLRICNGKTSEERMLAVVKWYVTSIHVGRQGSVAKKPYNPIIGETFTCSWRIPASCIEESPNKSDTEFYTIRYISEQVSHHPPVSAFYIECPEKEMCINAHIWTKSKFMGISIGVNLVGDISLSLGKFNESYSLSMPSAYARSVLTEPWVELGGRINVWCPESGCSAPIVFHTKPFYGGKLHKVTGEVKNSNSEILCKFQGEWDSSIELLHSGGKTEVLNISDMKQIFAKRVRPLEKQAPNESRILWHDVTTSLSKGDLNNATSHKRILEDKQRAEEQYRDANGLTFQTKLFHSPSPDRWVYNNMPPYGTAHVAPQFSI